MQSAVKSLYANSIVKRALGLFFVSPKCNYTRDKNTICFVVHENRISPIKNKSIPTNDLFHKVLRYKWFKYERNYFNVQWVMRCLINNSYSFLKKVMKKYFSSLSNFVNKIAVISLTHPLFPWSKGRYTLLTLVYEYAYKSFHFSPNKIPKHSFSNIAHSCFLFTDHHIKSSGLDFKHSK